EDLEEAPLGLFWAINVLILCSLACGVLVMSSFAAQVFRDDTMTEATEATEEVISPEVAELVETASGLSRMVRLLARIMVVALVSFTSGMGLRIIHPLQSAMLCGL
ncbi:CEP1, partial [Symbiodinium sp. CCMP2592]